MDPKLASLHLPSFKRTQGSHRGVRASFEGQEQRPISPAIRAAAKPDSTSLPLLPKAKRLNFSSHRNDANATLALDLLADVGNAITKWHQALQQTLLDIQALYMAGPIVEGWLEAVRSQDSQGNPGDAAGVLRHGDSAQVAAYVAKISRQASTGMAKGNTQYRLCNLDADGQMHCQLCPTEQLGVVSQAIARNQQLRQLLQQKHYLEARLKRAAESLEMTRQALDIPPKLAKE